MFNSADVVSAFVLGLMGSGHCLSMCGGLMSAFSFQIKGDNHRKLFVLLGYNLGRILSYVAIALIFAVILQNTPSTGLPVARTIAGVLLIAMGLYIGAWWRGLTRLEKLGGYLWRFIKPLADRWIPVNHFGPALLVGAVWGWLPCGLVYSALAYSAVQPTLFNSAITMAAFGLGTLPSVMLGGYAMAAFKVFLVKRSVRWGLALAYVAFGVWTIFNAWQHTLHSHNHGAEPMPDSAQSPSASQPVDHHHHH